MGDVLECHGSLVAFEGSGGILSTQFRLLPTSPNILVLPELEKFMKEDPNDSAFDPASYILRVHEASSARAEKACSFLRELTTQPGRIVFMNGGTASARMRCIAAISEHTTEGDAIKAEKLFNELIEDGPRGLQQALEAKSELHSMLQLVTTEPTSPEGSGESPSNDLPVHPNLEAMRAAEALDRKTESLQPKVALDISIPSLRRSMSLPAHSFGGVPDTPRSLIFRSSDDAVDESCSSDYSDDADRPYTPPSYDPSSLRTISFESATATPVIIGEAFLIEFRPLNSRLTSLQGMKPVDCLYASTIRSQDISLCNIHRSDSPRSDVKNRQRSSSQNERIPRLKRLSKTPHASIKSGRTTRRGPPSPLILTTSNRRLSAYINRRSTVQSHYVHHGTCTEKNYVDRGSNTDETDLSSKLLGSHSSPSDTTYQAVLPMVEDMVIYFKDGQSDSLLEHILRSLKETPRHTSPAVAPKAEDEVPSKLAIQQSVPYRGVSRQVDIQKAEIHTDEYDPYASHGEFLQSSPLRPSVPPTPAYTPPPQQVSSPQNNRFYELNVTNLSTAVDIQDSLRSALCAYFPSGGTPLRQPDSPYITEIGGDWQPVFGKTISDGSKTQKREIDLILAIGAQEGVDKEFLAALRGSLEKLGMKPRGITRSGRLDLRYLIANAVRANTAQPSPNKTTGDLSADPRFLATSIIPFLETYMAIHSETRFLLLEFPPDHLATVLALQDLIGNDLLRVAGVLDDGNDNLSPSSATRPRETDAESLSPLGSPRSPSFSKANFVLTASATESETATFISSIWKILVDRSPFYIPDGVPRTSATTQHNPAYDSNRMPLPQLPLVNSTAQYTPLDSAAVMMGFQSQAASPSHSKEGEREEKQLGVPLISPPNLPIAEKTVKTTTTTTTTASSRTAKALQLRKSKLKNLLGREPDNVSFFDLSDDDEDEGDDGDDGFAADERKYIPLFLKKRLEARKGNSRKALKFLGLSTDE